MKHLLYILRSIVGRPWSCILFLRTNFLFTPHLPWKLGGLIRFLHRCLLDIGINCWQSHLATRSMFFFFPSTHKGVSFIFFFGEN